jgi:phage-related holin
MISIFQDPIIKSEAVLAVIPSIAIATIVQVESVAGLLLILFLVDLLSGITASYFEWRKLKERANWFFNWNKGGFSSDLFKKSFLKGMIYGGFPLIVWKFQQVFLLKNITISTISTSQMDVTTICLLVFCANEIFSIFWENLPKCGVNIPKGIKGLINGIKEIKD